MDDEKLKLENLLDLATALNQQNNFQEILRLVTQQASDLLNADVTLIMMLNPRTEQTVKTVFKGGDGGEDPRFKTVYHQICGWLMKFREPLLSGEIKADDRLKGVDWGDLPIRSVMGVPLVTGGNLIGTLILINKGDTLFSETELAFLEKVAVIAAPYLRNVEQIQRYFEAPLNKSTLFTKYESLGILGKSKRFEELLQAIEAAARCDVRVLLVGQSGTGKELIANAIHKLSLRSNNPFVAMDCGAIPEHLIESELFGHVKGAFTGAIQDRIGLIEEANHGTLFMDEISNLPIEMQVKLLRVLQEDEIRALGSNKLIKVDVRIIAACSVSLKKLVDEQLFREDLYYRLHVYPIHVPSLKERKEDIPLLANHFLKAIAIQQRKKADSFQGKILGFLQQREWEGNIRELENFVERMVTLAPVNAQTLNSDLIPPDLKEEFEKFTAIKSTDIKSLNDRLKEQEEIIIRQALEENGWNQTKAAHSLKITEQLIRYRMKKLGMTRQ